MNEDKIRASFEEWAKSQDKNDRKFLIDRKDDGYVNTTMDIMWITWQAAHTSIAAKLDSDDMKDIIRHVIQSGGNMDLPSFYMGDNVLKTIKKELL